MSDDEDNVTYSNNNNIKYLQDYLKNKDYSKIYNILKAYKPINKKINNYVYIVLSLLYLKMGNKQQALNIITNLKKNNTNPDNIHIIWLSNIIILKEMENIKEAEIVLGDYIKMNNSNYYYNLMNKILDNNILIDEEIHKIIMKLLPIIN